MFIDSLRDYISTIQVNRMIQFTARVQKVTNKVKFRVRFEGKVYDRTL